MNVYLSVHIYKYKLKTHCVYILSGYMHCKNIKLLLILRIETSIAVALETPKDNLRCLCT